MLRRGERLTWLIGGTAIAASAAGVVVACLPDLAAPHLGPEDSGTPCGDGIIDLEGGEQCDPGPDATVPGCSRTCRIECDGGAGGSSHVDPASNHCYFLLSKEAGTFEAGSDACAKQGAHIITLGSSFEIGAVGNLRPAPAANGFWLGVGKADAGPDVPDGAYASVVDEPGFIPGGDCLGCFLGEHHLNPTFPLGTCARWSFDQPSYWQQWRCDVPLSTICEREPVGSRALPCGGPLCFDVQVDVENSARKTYAWFPPHLLGHVGRVDADAAVAQCAAITDGGASSLVIFDGPEQREQVFYELMHIRGGPAEDFWIGLSVKKLSPDGMKLGWEWDDMRGHGLPEWGGPAPPPTQEGLRAYASQTGTQYDKPAATFDTQLWHSQDAGTDAGTELHGVLCQILQP